MALVALKELRERSGLTQEQVAQKIGCVRSAVCKWEKGESSPRADDLPMLAALFRCSINDLFKKEE